LADSFASAMCRWSSWRRQATDVRYRGPTLIAWLDKAALTRLEPFALRSAAHHVVDCPPSFDGRPVFGAPPATERAYMNLLNRGACGRARQPE
jgi:hypothetical protein